jgi:hypothetical protein
MSHLIRDRAPSWTPIERIFKKVMHRKMTSQERMYFHLKREVKPPPRAKSSKHKQTRAA